MRIFCQLWVLLGAILLAIIPNKSFSQNQTVGIFLNTVSSLNGFTLLAPLQDTVTYLLDNCGRIVHSWGSHYRPALSAYLLPDGSLLRPTRILNSTFGNQSGGRIERVDWNGNLLWEYIYSSPTVHQHHDIELMPNGNVLILAFEYKTKAEIIAAGKDTAMARKGIWAEHIVEVAPIGSDSGHIVWEWHALDHIVQDYDSTKPNFGIVADHPELLNLNYRPVQGSPGDTADWMHANSVAYNHSLDQIVISSRTFSELLIIDHQTTSAEAASHQGGKRGRGGDVLYRWGNPEACGRGTPADQQLFFQHDVHWIPSGFPGSGHLLLFNNGFDRIGTDYSSIDELIIPVDSSGNYPIPGPGNYGPATVFWRYTSSPADSFFSAIISGTQRLLNGNTLICEGTTGHLFEVDSAGTLLWDYINPVNNLGRLSQGADPRSNNVFRAYRYGKKFPAFSGKTLIPLGYVELNPFVYNCTIYQDTLLSLNRAKEAGEFIFYPNPASGRFFISAPDQADYNVNVTDLMGRMVVTTLAHSPDYEVSICDISAGIYICSISNVKGAILKRSRLVISQAQP